MTPALDPTRTSFTDQEVFDAVVRHAAQMPGRCVAGELSNQCLYRRKRGEAENACFVGGLMTDEEAKQADNLAAISNDGSGVYALRENKLLPERLVPHVKLLFALQDVHDDEYYDREVWPELLKEVADKHELDPAVIDEAFAASKAA